MIACNKPKTPPQPHPDGSSTKLQKKSPVVCLSKSGVIIIQRLTGRSGGRSAIGRSGWFSWFRLPIDLVAGEGVDNENGSSYICIWFRLLVYDAVSVKVQSGRKKIPRENRVSRRSDRHIVVVARRGYSRSW